MAYMRLTYVSVKFKLNLLVKISLIDSYSLFIYTKKFLLLPFCPLTLNPSKVKDILKELVINLHIRNTCCRKYILFLFFWMLNIGYSRRQSYIAQRIEVMKAP